MKLVSTELKRKIEAKIDKTFLYKHSISQTCWFQTAWIHIQLKNASWRSHKPYNSPQRNTLLRRGSCYELLFNPGGGGGGGSEARMTKLTAANQKPLILWCPNLVTCSFYPQGTIWPNFSRGVAAALFSSRRPKNFENENIFLCLKIAEIDMGVNFGWRRTILDIKTRFLKVKPVFRG